MSWDTHIHIFDPVSYPFKAQRTYTPRPATVTDLRAASGASNFLLVQASIEDGHSGMLAHLQQLQAHLKAANGSVYGEISYESVEHSDDEELSRLRDAGIRVLRYHAGFAADLETTARTIRGLLEGDVRRILYRHGWALAMQLPLKVWYLLEDFSWDQYLAGIPIIIEHLGSVNLPLSDDARVWLQTLFRLLSRDNFWLKISATHRRMVNASVQSQMEYEILRPFADIAPDRLLWGSDWPHVDSRVRGSIAAPFMLVDVDAELAWLRSCLPSEVYEGMIMRNPARLFAEKLG